ncbi:unnamed protein product [Lymnaea stagnalis]|uniref:Uncharacterized protein n=1 Tax=Lymnaea stagnalis TaxID=6523 RepID=A0AAV2IM44_LYMST
MASHLTCVLVTLSVFWIEFSNSQFLTESSCRLSVPDDKNLLDRLAEYFHKDSDVIIVKYNITFNKVSRNFNLFKQLSSENFKPWRWYRTQGLHTSGVLRSYEKYFGMLHTLLLKGVEEETLLIDASPPDCMDQMRNEDLENLIAKFLLKDFGINGNSWRRKFTYAEDVEICTASVGERDGSGKLIFKCCGLNSDQSITCNDISADDWAVALNYVLLIWAGILFLCFPFVKAKIDHLYGDEIYRYIIPEGYDLKFDCLITKNSREREEYVKIITLEKDVWKKMECFKNFKEGEIQTVSAKTLSIRAAKHKLYNKCQNRYSKSGLLNFLLNSEPKGSKNKVAFVAAIRRFLLLAVLALTNVPIFYAHFEETSLYTQLMKVYKDRGLQGRFYFHWGHDLDTEKELLLALAILYGFYCLFFVVDPFLDCEFSDKQDLNIYFQREFGVLKENWRVLFKEYFFALHSLSFTAISMALIRSPKCTSGNSKCRVYTSVLMVCFFFLVTSFPLMLALYIGIHFVLHALVMVTFTIVVEVGFYSSILRGSVFGLAFVLEFFRDLGEKHKHLKDAVLCIFKGNSVNESNRNVIYPITPQTIDQYLSTKQNGDGIVLQNNQSSQLIDTSSVLHVGASSNVDGERNDSPKNIFDDLEPNDSELLLKLNLPCLFISKDDVPSVSRNFLSKCNDIDCVGAPGKSNIFGTVLSYVVFAGTLAIMFSSVCVYGHHHYITHGVFVTFAVSFVALVIKRLYANRNTLIAIDKDNRKCIIEIRKKLNLFNGKLRVHDFEDMEIMATHEDRPILLVLKDNPYVKRRVRARDPNERAHLLHHQAETVT